jgi:hypothetical protein
VRKIAIGSLGNGLVMKRHRLQAGGGCVGRFLVGGAPVQVTVGPAVGGSV